MKYKLNAFIKVAQKSSFTLASKELNLSQPAVSKTISNLEKEYNTTFFNRSRNAISLTNEGKLFLDYAYKISALFEEMENTFLLKHSNGSHLFNLGLSTTIASYIMPKIFAKIQRNAPDIKFNITSSNTKEIEVKILNNELDVAIVEGKSSDQLLTYIPFIKDELVLVSNAKNSKLKSSITKEELKTIPFVSREVGSGTRDIIESVLKTHNIHSLNHVITLNSTEAIEQYVCHSEAYALLSVHALTEKLLHNKLKVVEIKGMRFEREFFFVSRTGFQSQKMDLLINLIRTNYNF